jgi:hypothetical protein
MILDIAFPNHPQFTPVNAGPDDGRNVTGAQEQPICQKRNSFNELKYLTK